MEASEEEIAQALEGNWQEDQLFVLRQEQVAYEFCQKQITGKTENHFVSWRKLSPDNKISGGKVIAERSHAHQQPHDHCLKDGHYSDGSSWRETSGQRR